MLQSPNHLGDSPLGSLQYLHASLVLKSPRLDTGLQMWSHKYKAEGNNHFLLPAESPYDNTAQYVTV